MLLNNVVEVGPTEEVSECNESENVGSNMCKTLSTCALFEESVPGPSTTINLDTFVQSINTTQRNTEAPRGSLLPCSLKIMY